MKSPQTSEDAAARLFTILKVFAPGCAGIIIVFILAGIWLDHRGWTRDEALLFLAAGMLVPVILGLLVVIYAVAYHLKFR